MWSTSISNLAPERSVHRPEHLCFPPTRSVRHDGRSVSKVTGCRTSSGACERGSGMCASVCCQPKSISAQRNEFESRRIATRPREGVVPPKPLTNHGGATIAKFGALLPEPSRKRECMPRMVDLYLDLAPRRVKVCAAVWRSHPDSVGVAAVVPRAHLHHNPDVGDSSTLVVSARGIEAFRWSAGDNRAAIRLPFTTLSHVPSPDAPADRLSVAALQQAACGHGIYAPFRRSLKKRLLTRDPAYTTLAPAARLRNAVGGPVSPTAGQHSINPLRSLRC